MPAFILTKRCENRWRTELLLHASSEIQTCSSVTLCSNGTCCMPKYGDPVRPHVLQTLLLLLTDVFVLMGADAVCELGRAGSDAFFV